MTTCPNCGSEYADGTSCVVCGFEPEARPDTTEGRDAAGSLPPAAPDDDLTVGPVARPGDAAADWPDAASSRPGDDDEATEPATDDTVTGSPAMAGAVTGGVGAASAPAGGPPPSADPGGGTAPPGPSGPAGLTGPTGPTGQVPPAVTPHEQPGSAGQPTPPRPGALPVTENERNWGMVAHLSALVAAGVGGMGFLGPLIVWLVKKDDSRFVRHHAVEALNFNLSLMLYALLAVVVALTVVGLVVAIPALVVGFVLWFVTSIVAAVKAQRGESYRYPLTIRLIRE